MKIICIGRNYADHAKELNNPIPEEPVIFMKPESALLPKRNPFYIPAFTNEVHHEIELVLRVCRLGKKIHKNFAHKYYDSIGLGIDFTARDVQQDCKQKGLPWEKAKAFDGSAPMGDRWIPKSEFADLNDIDFSLKKNGEVAQAGNTKDLLFDFDELIVQVSKYFTLKNGDMIFTGTPAGVGPVQIGDTLEGFIGDEQLLKVNIK